MIPRTRSIKDLQMEFAHILQICTPLHLKDLLWCSTSAMKILAAILSAQRRCHLLQVCTETFGSAPEVVISGSSAQLATMPYIPTHLDYMLYELLKNAMRAVVQSHKGRALPALRVEICKAQSSVTLRISDQVLFFHPSPALTRFRVCLLCNNF